MTDTDRRDHWDEVYHGKGETRVSWYQETPTPSLELIDRAGITAEDAVVDIGGGASRLVDALLDRGVRTISVLDLSRAALDAAASRLGVTADRVTWIVADVTAWTPDRLYDLWHDRAAFHFLVDPAARAAYVACLTRALRPGGHAIIATFAPDGPERCSGLPVVRWDATSLAATLGDGFELVESRRHLHLTPSNAPQSFQFSLFRRRPLP